MLLDFKHIRSLAKLQELSNEYKESWQQNILSFSQQIFRENTRIRVTSSGTTGKVREMFFTRQQLMYSAKMTGEYFNFSKDKTLLLCLSPDFIAGKMMIARAMYWKMKLLCLKHSANPLANLSQSAYFASLVPYQVEKILNEIPEKFSLLQHILVGGAPMSTLTKEQIKDLPPNFYESFGMSETLSHFAIKKLSKKPENYFTTLPNVKIFLNKNKCLGVSLPFLKNPIITNDLVEIISKNQFRWIGRYDHMINSGGIKIIPEKLERKIKHIINSEFVFSSLPDCSLGEKLVLVIEDKKGEIDTEKLLHQLKKILGKYEIPKKIILLKTLCKTTNGKIQRGRIKRRLLEFK